ncbi:hypothetical protein BB561_001175 [Smittium simulii]|uniref:mitogen-activated protein kinase kinase n=1 Tax=Smittium simulii TaxID=133385 RepID=A0A2T9YVY3_9FUNG|nr:hypothetical protein BB561_001175 [Smittium simulii]
MKKKPTNIPSVVIPSNSNNSSSVDNSSSAASRKQSRDLFQNYLTSPSEDNPINDITVSMERVDFNSFGSSDIKTATRKPRPFVSRINTSIPADHKVSDFPNLSIFSSSASKTSHFPKLDPIEHVSSSQTQSPAILSIHTQNYRNLPSPNLQPTLGFSSTSKSSSSKSLSRKQNYPSKPKRLLETGSETNIIDSEPETDPNDQDYILNETTTEIMSKLGEGAVGTVYKIRHIPTGKLMAIKSVDVYPDETNHRQLLRELSFLKYCNSPYIVKFYGARFVNNEDGQSIYMYMEYCDAGSLDTIYKKIDSMNGRIGEGVLGKVAESVLNGLVYLHKNKIIHRDIKPSNILVTGSGQIKLCDLGVSGELVDSIAQTFVGTSYYMAPERIQGAGYAVTSDVWSLGLSLLEIALNRFPFPPEGAPRLTIIELLDYIVRVPIPSLPESQFSSEIINFIDIW